MSNYTALLALITVVSLPSSAFADDYSVELDADDVQKAREVRVHVQKRAPDDLEKRIVSVLEGADAEVRKCVSGSLEMAEARGASELTIQLDKNGSVAVVNVGTDSIKHGIANCIANVLKKGTYTSGEDKRTVRLTLKITRLQLDKLEIGPGAGGMGMRGTGSDESKVGYGRVSGIGTVDSTGGKTGEKDHKFKPKVDPELDMKLTSHQGPHEEKEVRQALENKARAFEYCYRKQLQVDPSLEGTVSVEFTIQSRGNTTATVSESTLDNPKTEACLARVMVRIRFDSADAQTTGTAEMKFSNAAAE